MCFYFNLDPLKTVNVLPPHSHEFVFVDIYLFMFWTIAFFRVSRIRLGGGKVHLVPS